MKARFEFVAHSNKIFSKNLPMLNLHLPAYTPNVHKKKRVFKESKGYFMFVKCSDCEEQTVCYSHSQTNIHCKGCSAMILKSTGGTAELVNKAKSKLAVSEY